MNEVSRFAQIPEPVIKANISDGAFRLYAVLALEGDYRTGVVRYRSQDALAEMAGKTERTVRNLIHELVEAGLVEVSRSGSTASYKLLGKQLPHRQKTSGVDDRQKISGGPEADCRSDRKRASAIHRESESSSDKTPRAMKPVRHADSAGKSSHSVQATSLGKQGVQKMQEPKRPKKTTPSGKFDAEQAEWQIRTRGLDRTVDFWGEKFRSAIEEISRSVK
jgi:hypothetical protein